MVNSSVICDEPVVPVISILGLMVDDSDANNVRCFKK